MSNSLIKKTWVDEGGGKKAPLPKICYTYPAMMKLGTVIP